MTRVAQAPLTRALLMPSWPASQVTTFPVARGLVASAGTCRRMRPGIQWRTENCIAEAHSPPAAGRAPPAAGPGPLCLVSRVLVGIVGVQFDEMVEREDHQCHPHRRCRG